jgi:hypothetical protein
VSTPAALARIEELIDTAGIAPRIEAMLPIGVRHRQLRVRTLPAGMLMVLADQRPAHLTRLRDALIALPEPEQARPGVTEDWKTGPHQLTYRQTERTFGLVADALAKDAPDGLPSQALAVICDDLLEAGIPGEHEHASTALAVDWTDVQTFSRPPSRGTSDCAGPEASRGHRSGGGPGQDSELFFGYYASAATMTREEHGPAVPEPARRMTACTCRHDPARALVPALTAMPGHRIPPGDVLADSGYAHRHAEAWATPLRQSGAQLVQDLHPSDRGPRRTHHGAIIANGNLSCPATPPALLQLGPPACCTQQTITVPPQTCAKTAQKHDYPSKQHRRSYARRTGAERTFSTAKDPATNNIAPGWTRATGLAPLMPWLTCLLAVRNHPILTARDARQDDNARRAAAGLPPRTRRRRRNTLTDPATAGTPP